MKDLRKNKKEPNTHKDFSFVTVDDEWDTSILILANPEAPPRRWLKGFSLKEGRSKVNRIYIKFHSKEAMKMLTSLVITNQMTDGMMPRVTKPLLVNYYNQLLEFGNVKVDRL